MRKLIGEFKKFISRGSVVDLAVAVVIGTAFNKITSSFVADIINPLLSLMLGKVDLTELVIKLSAEVNLTYGNLIQALLDFLVISFSIFMALKFINRVRDKAEKSTKQLAKLTKKLEEKVNLSKKEEKQLQKLEEKAKATTQAAAAPPPAPTLSSTDSLLTEIRDLLKIQTASEDKSDKIG